MVAFTLAKKLFSNCCTLRFVESYFAVMDRFVMKRSRNPHPGSNSAFSKATNTPSTSLSANASDGPGYLNLLGPSRPNLNYSKETKIIAAFVLDGFKLILHQPMNSTQFQRLLKAFSLLNQNCAAHRRSWGAMDSAWTPQLKYRQ